MDRSSIRYIVHVRCNGLSIVNLLWRFILKMSKLVSFLQLLLDRNPGISFDCLEFHISPLVTFVGLQMESNIYHLQITTIATMVPIEFDRWDGWQSRCDCGSNQHHGSFCL